MRTELHYEKEKEKEELPSQVEKDSAQVGFVNVLNVMIRASSTSPDSSSAG